ncbi:unnamed protein product, partial [Discosporangium mesarthrocarpum]
LSGTGGDFRAQGTGLGAWGSVALCESSHRSSDDVAETRGGREGCSQCITFTAQRDACIVEPTGVHNDASSAITGPGVDNVSAQPLGLGLSSCIAMHRFNLGEERKRKGKIGGGAPTTHPSRQWS